MAYRYFEIETYNTFLFNKFLTTKQGVTITARGMIICNGDDVQQVRAYFLAEGSPAPDPFVDRDGKRLQMFLPYQMMQSWIDLLRNEKPIYAVYDTDNPQWSYVSTLSEPVGEEES
jgi:hypothetical protein